MSLTPAQLKAVAAKGNVLVIAGAGTGKTRTLVERCLNCLIEGTPPLSLDQILMVTFTEAAAAEMRQRIRERLEAELNKQPDNLRWHEQLALFDTAHIGTLHSFCLQLIRPHFYELELDPQVSVMAEEEAQLLGEETLTALLQGHYSGQTPEASAVQELVQAHGGGSDKPVRQLVMRLHHYTQTLPDPAAWFQHQIEMFAPPQSAKWEEWLLMGFTQWREQTLLSLEAKRGEKIAEQCASILNAVRLPVSRGEAAAALLQLATLFEKCKGGNRPSWVNRIASETQFLLSVADANGGVDPLLEDWQWIRGQMTTVLKLAQDFGDAFSQNKRELAMLDFHDLEQHALRLLWDNQKNQPTAIALGWRKKLRFVFVDEYQDINAAQDRIIEAISSQGTKANRFLVGDVKQSIYRFRLANPNIFQNYARNWKDGAGETIPLVENFRARERILDFINSLFGLVMRPELGGILYDKQAQLRFGDRTGRQHLTAEADAHPRVELHLRVKRAATDMVLNEETDERLAEVLELGETDKEARLLALRLQELKTQQHPIRDENTKQFRPVEWSDMAILLRSPANKTESYAKEFARINIPLVVHRSGFYESTEISDLLSLLQILDNPLQDLPVLAVLHSPLAGLTINELATIRLSAKGYFWTALVLWNDNQKARRARKPTDADGQAEARQSNTRDAGETFRKVTVFLTRFAHWRRLARQTSLSRCLDAVLAETHYDSWLMTQPRGPQRYANVQQFLRLAQKFDTFQRQGLFRFLCFVDAQKRANAEPEVKAATAENAVRLMSIHQSKGLEFPVVVLADMGKPFNLIDLNARIILDDHYGLCPQIKPPHTGKRYPSLPHWLARRRQWRELLGEELRLLYVAMTRARDTLLLSASVSKNRLSSLWLGNKPEPVNEARSFSDWLGLWFAQNCAPSLGPFGSASSLRSLHGELAGSEFSSNKRGIETPTLASGQNQVLRWVVLDETDLLDQDGVAADQPAPPTPDAAPSVLEQLSQRLSWKYGHSSATRTVAKVSVTALRRRAMAHLEEETFQTPIGTSNIQEKSASFRKRSFFSKRLAKAADIGTAHHTFLQMVSLESTGSVEALMQEVKRLEQEQSLTAQECELLDIDAVAAFWKSELGQEILGRREFLRRELAFTTRLSPRDIAAFTGERVEPELKDEFVIVQGVADFVAVTAQDIWLVDFKTDSVKAGELQDKVALYEPQMRLYAAALSQIYKRPVSGCWLYFLMPATPVRIPLGKTAGRKADL